MSSITRICIINTLLPKQIRLPDEGKKFGGDLGDCALNTYVSANQSKYKPSLQCLAEIKDASVLDKDIK